MTARLIDGTAISAQVREEVREAAQEILNATGQRPGLAVILVGDSAASQVYVRNKIRACEAAGFHSVSEHLPEETTEAALLARLDELNKDPAVHGILVQLPLPAHIDTRRVIEAISPDKDVDGFHVANAGALMTGAPQLVPCTPLGVMRLLESTGVPLRGAEAVIVGASNLVGKPQLHLLLQAGATVTLCNSKTRDLAAQTRRADILVVAVGRPRMITGDMIKPGAVVIDVGINRLPDGKLTGDVDFDSARNVAGWITPVPGGVGPMTIAMLLQNTIPAARRHLKLACRLPGRREAPRQTQARHPVCTAIRPVCHCACRPCLASVVFRAPHPHLGKMRMNGSGARPSRHPASLSGPISQAIFFIPSGFLRFPPSSCHDHSCFPCCTVDGRRRPLRQPAAGRPRPTAPLHRREARACGAGAGCAAG